MLMASDSKATRVTIMTRPLVSIRRPGENTPGAEVPATGSVAGTSSERSGDDVTRAGYGRERPAGPPDRTGSTRIRPARDRRGPT